MLLKSRLQKIRTLLFSSQIDNKITHLFFLVIFPKYYKTLPKIWPTKGDLNLIVPYNTSLLNGLIN